MIRSSEVEQEDVVGLFWWNVVIDNEASISTVHSNRSRECLTSTGTTEMIKLDGSGGQLPDTPLSFDLSVGLASTGAKIRH